MFRGADSDDLEQLNSERSHAHWTPSECDYQLGESESNRIAEATG